MGRQQLQAGCDHENAGGKGVRAGKRGPGLLTGRNWERDRRADGTEDEESVGTGGVENSRNRRASIGPNQNGIEPVAPGQGETQRVDVHNWWRWKCQQPEGKNTASGRSQGGRDRQLFMTRLPRTHYAKTWIIDHSDSLIIVRGNSLPIHRNIATRNNTRLTSTPNSLFDHVPSTMFPPQTR